MIYIKPKNVTYTQMAMFIDEHAYDEDTSNEQNNLIFEYLFHLVEMLAYKAKFFQKYQYYEDFALYVASSVYLRLKNPRQFKYDENGQPKLKRIKSILNYIKTILYPKKVDFEQEHYDQTFSKVDDTELNSDIGIGYTFADSLIDSLDQLSKVNFKLCLKDITNTIRSYVYNLPFKNDKVFINNLYLSCLLTFLSSITPKSSDLERISKLKLASHREVEIDELLEDSFTVEDVIVFHLDNKYRKYIYLLTKEIKHLIANDLSLILNDELGSESALKSILINDIIDKGIANEEDE